MESLGNLEELKEISYIKRWLRWSIACLVGIGMVYLSEPGSWAELHQFDGYFLAIAVSCLISVCISKLINHVSIALDRKFNWFKRPFYRMILQLSLGVAFPIAIAVLFIWIYFTANNYSFEQTTYFERVFTSLCLVILITNVYYPIHYLAQVLKIVARKKRENQFIIQEHNRKLTANALADFTEQTKVQIPAQEDFIMESKPVAAPLQMAIGVAEIAIIFSKDRVMACYDWKGVNWGWTLSLKNTMLDLSNEDFCQISKSCIIARDNILAAFHFSTRATQLVLLQPKGYFALVSQRENTAFVLWYKKVILPADQNTYGELINLTAKPDSCVDEPST